MHFHLLIPLPLADDEVISRHLIVTVGDQVIADGEHEPELLDIGIDIETEEGTPVTAALTHRNIFGEVSEPRIEQAPASTERPKPGKPGRFPLLFTLRAEPSEEALLALLGEPTIKSNV